MNVSPEISFLEAGMICVSMCVWSCFVCTGTCDTKGEGGASLKLEYLNKPSVTVTMPSDCDRNEPKFESSAAANDSFL